GAPRPRLRLSAPLWRRVLSVHQGHGTGAGFLRRVLREAAADAAGGALPAAGARGVTTSLLQQLWEYGVLSPLDYHFASSLAALGDGNEETVFCAALASRAVQLGHVCLDLTRVADLRFVDRQRADDRRLEEDAPAQFVCPSPERLQAALRASPLCGDGARPTPL